LTKHKRFVEGSSHRAIENDSEEELFGDVIPVNAMPSTPPPKKEYLEDYDDFTVQWVVSYVDRQEFWFINGHRTLPTSDESYFPQVQDRLLRRQYLNVPPLR